MKKILLIAAIFLSVNCSSQAQKSLSNPAYADQVSNKPCEVDYKMKKYIMAFLMPGETDLYDAIENKHSEIAHYKNIRDLTEKGKLVVAESFVDHQYIKAIYILNVETIAEARKLFEGDEAILNGKFRMEFHPWYGSADLVKTMGIYEIIAEKNMIE